MPIDTIGSPTLWAAFTIFVLAMLALDLGVFHRKAHEVRLKEAAAWSAVWVALAAVFNVAVWTWFGPTKGLEFLTGYVIEKALSVDNVFVFLVIFSYFSVPKAYQHRVLFWGIVGALVMRGAMIAIGAALITRFSWIIYVFGGFLILTGIKMLVVRGEGGDLERNPVVRLARRLFSITERYHGARFFVRAGSAASHAPAVEGGPVEPDRVVDLARKGALLATPLFLALILVELTDLIFAVDSIPAIFAITTDPFLVFTSNIFAILGLRSLYFALAGMIDSFRYLKVSLSLVLVVIGVKMLTHGWLKAWLGTSFNFYVLGVVGGIIAAGVIASLVARRREPAPPPPAGDLPPVAGPITLR